MTKTPPARKTPFVIYQPPKSVTIHHATAFLKEDFVHAAVGMGFDVRWNDGIMFSPFPGTSREEYYKHRIRGEIHYTEIYFAKCDKYEHVLTDNRSGGKVTMYNYGTDWVAHEITHFLRQQFNLGDDLDVDGENNK